MTAQPDLDFEPLARALAESAPPGWVQAVVRTEFDANALSISTYDYVDGEGREHWFDPDAAHAAAIGRHLRAIRDAAMARGAGWSRCSFVLSHTGTFRFDVAQDS